jgi:hypothetical protein
MAYDEELGWRIREQLSETNAVSERRMFGGLAFLVGGHMAVAASGRGGLLVRSPYDGEPGTEPMVMSGRPARGWLRVAPEAIERDDQLAQWVARGVAGAQALPPK